MKTLSQKLLQMIITYLPQINKIPSQEWVRHSSPGKWCKQEILGHLIDSAANNHQRIVRARYQENPLVVYDQDRWVSIQHYDRAPIGTLISLWEHYNRHLAHIVASIPEDKQNSLCDINKEQPVTLKWLVTDYIRHLEYHLQQIVT